MILNKLYRLKRKKGAVLFVVIAMMTLLVIMATAAYYTARSSHQTVINNYDFSQLYLSAVSVSDMVVDAVTNNTVDNTSGRNNFSALQSAILDKNFTVGKKITAKSDKITPSMTTAEQILTQTASDPQIAGILDAVQIVISHEDKQKILDTDVKEVYMDYYLFTTTAYYRNNTITIQDRIGRETVKPKDGNLFTTFFTATGKNIVGGVEVDDPTRCVVISTKEISDDAFFENKYTVFREQGFNGAGGNMNKFLGGMSSAGSIWIDQFNSQIAAPTSTTRNDWVIKESLVLGGNGQQFDINGNNLIIQGDLILTKNMNNFYAENIIVMGNIVDLSGGSANSNLNANIYVDGTIITGLTINDSDSDYVKAAKANAKTTLDGINEQYKKSMGATLGVDWTTIGDLSGYGAVGGNSTQLNFNSKTVRINHPEELNSSAQSRLSTAAGGKSEKWTEDDVEIFLQNRDVSSNKSKYDYSLSNSSIEGAVGATKSGAPYKTYSASDDTMNHTLTIDFSDSSAFTERKTPEGQPTGIFDGTFAVSGVSGTDATVTINNSGNGEVTVDLPYCDNGYVLDLKFDGTSFNHQKITYNIDSGSSNDDKLPIVLKANFDDGKGASTDSRGYNAFCWNVGVDINNNPYPTNVSVNGEGDVIFEVGSYDASGDYKPFKLADNLTTPTYYTLENLRMGTDDQLAEIPQGNNSDSALKDLLENGGKGPDLQSSYDNQIILVSNKIGGVAVNDDRKNTLMCGYLYAPFSNYSNLNSSGQSAPQLGGMIVANYATQFGYFVYAEPDPKLIENLSAGLPNQDNTKVDESIKWVVRDSSKGLGSNFIG